MTNEISFANSAEIVLRMPTVETLLGAVAQVSRNKGDMINNSFWTDGIVDSEGEEKTLRFCIKAGHLSILEFAQIVFKIECPIFVARQLMRYRNASYIERSLRYCEPTTREWMKEIEDPEAAATTYSTVVAHEDYSRTVYDELVQQGVRKEQARAVLPLSTQTVFLMRVDLRELLHIFDDRLTPHCQRETRDLVQQMYDETKLCYPITIDEYSKKK